LSLQVLTKSTHCKQRCCEPDGLSPESAQKVTQNGWFGLAHAVHIGKATRLTEPGNLKGEMNMKKLLIVAASLMFAVTAQAEDQFEIGVEMTPMVKQQKVVAKSDARFDNYALENAAAGGQ
jgi:hypothetical protein